MEYIRAIEEAHLNFEQGYSRRALKQLQNVFKFYARKALEDMLNGRPPANLTNNHSYCHTHISDTRIAIHDLSITCNSICNLDSLK